MKKTELEILKELKFEFELLSDFTTQSQGYKNLCDKIEKLEKEKTEKVLTSLEEEEQQLEVIINARYGKTDLSPLLFLLFVAIILYLIFNQ